MSTFNYSFQTGIGLNPYLLKNIKDVVGQENAPQLKVDNLGFLNLLNSQKKTLQVNRPTAPGAIEFVQVKYMQRLVVGQTSTNDTCATANVTPFMEATVPLNIYRQIAIYIEDGLMQEYTDDLNRTQALGLPPTMAMRAMVEQIMGASNALLVGIDQDLQNQVIIGTNPVTGTSASKTINMTQNTTTLPLNDGMTEILTEALQAEFASGKLQVYGSGLFLNFMMQQRAKGMAQNGLNTVIQAAECDFYYDQYASSILGANQIVAISPDSIQLVEFARYTGPYGGHKGISDFGSFVLPIQMTPTNVIPMQFDFQLRYLDCPETVATVNDYYGTPLSGQRGYQMIISKRCGLFQTPTNAYKANDFLVNSNGTLRYTITNV